MTGIKRGKPKDKAVLAGQEVRGRGKPKEWFSVTCPGCALVVTKPTRYGVKVHLEGCGVAWIGCLDCEHRVFLIKTMRAHVFDCHPEREEKRLRHTACHSVTGTVVRRTMQLWTTKPPPGMLARLRREARAKKKQRSASRSRSNSRESSSSSSDAARTRKKKRRKKRKQRRASPSSASEDAPTRRKKKKKKSKMSKRHARSPSAAGRSAKKRQKLGRRRKKDRA